MALDEQPLKKIKQGVLRQAHIIDPVQGIDAVGDVVIKAGKIVSIHTKAGVTLGETSKAQGAWDLDLNLKGKIICPSFVDIGCSIPDPGFEQKGTFATELSAALAGGYGHLALMPNTLPVADSPAVLSLMSERALVQPAVQVLPMGALTSGLEGRLLSEHYALKVAGCVALTQGRYPISDLKIKLNALEYAKTQDLLVCFFSESADLAKGGCVHEGATAARMGLPGIPVCAETTALAQDLLLVEHTGVRAHFCQLSSKRSVDLIAQAQASGLAVTADVSMVNLVYTDESLASFDPVFHLRPPLRAEQDRQALLEGVKSGVIAAISSAHTPHECAAKLAPFAATEPGVSTLDTQVHWANSLVRSSELTHVDWVRGLCGAAPILGLAPASLTLGANACFNVIDPAFQWDLSESSMLSCSKHSPLLGQPLSGKVLFQVRGDLN